MLKAARVTQLAAFTFLGVALAPHRGHAQSADRIVPFTFTIPISLSKIDPSITHVRLRCVVREYNAYPLTSSEWNGPPVRIPVSELPKTVTHTFTVNVSPSLAGKTGEYQCVLWGWDGGQKEHSFAPNAVDARWKTAAGSSYAVQGTFVF